MDSCKPSLIYSVICSYGDSVVKLKKFSFLSDAINFSLSLCSIVKNDVTVSVIKFDVTDVIKFSVEDRFCLFPPNLPKNA